MRYMMLVYANEQAKAALSEEENRESASRVWDIIDEARRRGIFKGADPLEPVSTATTVRVANGKTFVTDGPFAETKEQLGGYFMLECEDLDEALEWAAKIPACGGGCVEVRPVRDIPARPA